MRHENSFSSNLIHELKDVELLPSYDEFTSVSRAVILRGRKELTSFRKETGNLIWWKEFVRSGQWYFSYIGIAGWGYYLSSYFNAPLHLSPAQNETIGHLGALCSVIVTLYDSLIDKSISFHPPIPPDQLHNLLSTHQVFHSIGEKFASGSNQLLPRLIALFILGIHQLPFVEQRPNILSLLEKCILKMYEAENKTVMYMPQDINKSILIRKSAYPFVIMGLIGWFASSYFEQGLFDWHLRWLYNMGSFFSFIDDTADLHSDRRRGSPNLFIDHVDTANQFDWAKKIACKGMLLHSEWKQKVADHRLPFNVSMVLSSSLASWLM